MPKHNLPFPTAIDSTIRKTFASCEQKFFYEFVEGLSLKHHSIHLHAGATFARGLEVFRKEFFLMGKTQIEAVESARIAMVVEWGDYEPMFSWSEGQTEAKSLDALMDAIDFYLFTWEPTTDPIQPLIEGGNISVEFSFAIPIPHRFHPVTGDPLLYAGRFDMMGVYNNTLFVVDEKTTKQLGASWSDQWEMRSQFTGYAWAAREYGYPVGGAVVRGISFLKNGFGSAQSITYREDWKIEQWLRQLQRNVDRMIEVWKSGEPDMDLDDACNSFAGCPFKRLCNSPQPEQWKSDYVERRWNPLDKL
jgi:hypothetical protein